jgi:hypothetical protein
MFPAWWNTEFPVLKGSLSKTLVVCDKKIICVNGFFKVFTPVNGLFKDFTLVNGFYKEFMLN